MRLITTPAVIQKAWTPPVGIAQLAGSLRSKGVEVHCLDFNPENDYGSWLPLEILGMEPKIYAAECFRKKYPGKLRVWAEAALEDEPDLIGLSILYHGMLVPSFALAMQINDLRPETVIIMGGPFVLPSNHKLISYLLQHESISGIFQGEGEQGILEVVAALKEKRSISTIPGMWTKKENGYIVSPPAPQLDPNQLPLADFSDFDIEKYREAWHGSFPIFGSRGCVNRCTFCNSRKHVPYFRQRSTEHIMKEIELDIEKYWVNRIAFTDNLVNGNPREFKNLCRALIDRFHGLEVFGMISLLPSVDNEMLDLMKEAGFVDILLAIESPVPRVRRDMGKWPDKEGVTKIVKGAVERGLKPCVYLMHSFPTEREEEFEELLHFMDEFDSCDFMHVGAWPFRLAQVQVGELDMNFVRRFDIELLGGYGFDRHNACQSFDREPRWKTRWVNDDIKIERQNRISKLLDTLFPDANRPPRVRKK